MPDGTDSPACRSITKRSVTQGPGIVPEIFGSNVDRGMSNLARRLTGHFIIKEVHQQIVAHSRNYWPSIKPFGAARCELSRLKHMHPVSARCKDANRLVRWGNDDWHAAIRRLPLNHRGSMQQELTLSLALKEPLQREDDEATGAGNPRHSRRGACRQEFKMGEVPLWSDRSPQVFLKILDVPHLSVAFRPRRVWLIAATCKGLGNQILWHPEGYLNNVTNARDRIHTIEVSGPQMNAGSTSCTYPESVLKAGTLDRVEAGLVKSKTDDPSWFTMLVDCNARVDQGNAWQQGIRQLRAEVTVRLACGSRSILGNRARGRCLLRLLATGKVSACQSKQDQCLMDIAHIVTPFSVTKILDAADKHKFLGGGCQFLFPSHLAGFQYE